MPIREAPPSYEASSSELDVQRPGWIENGAGSMVHRDSYALGIQQMALVMNDRLSSIEQQNQQLAAQYHEDRQQFQQLVAKLGDAIAHVSHKG